METNSSEPAAPVPTVAGPIEEAPAKDVVLRFEAKRCIHARFCVLQRPNVFLANVKGPWLHPEATSVEGIAAVASNCPSGAITYQRLDGGPNEAAPPVNLISIRENGPLAFRGPLTIDGRAAGFRATLCRCGESHNKPFCDGSHATAKFTATGEPATEDSPVLVKRDGPLDIAPQKNGPLVVSGNVEICSGTGRTVLRTTAVALCRCGHSLSKPLCDGSHNRVGFQS